MSPAAHDPHPETGTFTVVLGPPGAARARLVAAHGGNAPGALVLDGATLVGTRSADADATPAAPLPWLSAFANVFLAADRTAPWLTVAAKRRQAEYWLRILRLDTVTTTLARDLAPTARARLVYARCWALDPGLLVLEEPFASLAAELRPALAQALGHLWARHPLPVVMTTTDVDEALLLADRVLPVRGDETGDVAEVAVAIRRPRTPASLPRDPLAGPLRSALAGALVPIRSGGDPPRAA